MPSPIITPDLKRFEAHRNALCEEIDRSRERLLARGSKFVAELNIVIAKAAEFKSSLDCNAVRVCFFEGGLVPLKAA